MKFNVAGALAALTLSVALSTPLQSADLQRVTCSGEFASGSGRAGSTLGKCNFQADSDPEKSAQKMCATQRKCTLDALEKTLPSGYGLIVKVFSPTDIDKSSAPPQLGSEVATNQVRKFFNRYLDQKSKFDLFGTDDALTREFFSRSFIADFVEGTRSDEPVIDANVITGRQEGSITRILKYWTVLYTGQTAVIGVSAELTDEAEPPIKTVETHQYLLVQDGRNWRIDDMTQDPKEGLSVRAILRREIEGRSRRTP